MKTFRPLSLAVLDAVVILAISGLLSAPWLVASAKNPYLVLSGELRLVGTAQENDYILVLDRGSYQALPQKIRQYLTKKKEPIVFLVFLEFPEDLQGLQEKTVEIYGEFAVLPKDGGVLRKKPRFLVRTIKEIEQIQH